MKKFVLSMVTLLTGAIIVSGQNVVRNGKEYSVTQTQKSSGTYKKTGYTWKDKSGDVYDIYISSKGACFIIRISKKTGKEYRQYLPKEIQNEIRNELK